MIAPDSFAGRLLAWFDRFGRKDLPWQRDPTPYRVWVSEIMLQQTQVATVIPYFQRFMTRFPTVESLAAAAVDDVLHHWSGLGYYARGRNLHAAAKAICDRHGGKLPDTLADLIGLPGIGRSTAAAIQALSRGRREVILDGNVKRVLCRHHAVEEWPGSTGALRTLWALAERVTPNERVGEYTQAIMDLGATVCVRRRPLCHACPLAADCAARRDGRQHELPAPRPKRVRPERSICFLVARNPAGEVLLRRRPPTGIWGGLWGFPECAVADDPLEWCRTELGAAPARVARLTAIEHGFTHFKLTIQPILLDVVAPPADGVADTDTVWYNPRAPMTLGLAAPVSVLLASLGRIELPPTATEQEPT